MATKLSGILEVDYPEFDPRGKTPAQIAQIDEHLRAAALDTEFKLPDGATMLDWQIRVREQQAAEAEAERLGAENAATAQNSVVAVQNGEVVAAPGLPENFPAREHLIAAGLTTLDAVRAVSKENLTTVPHVKTATADKIVAAIAEIDKEENE